MIDKRYLQYAGIGLVLIIVLLIGWRYWHSGVIVVTTSSTNAELIIKDANGSIKAKKKTTKLKKRLNKGEYSAEASSSDGSSTQVVNLRARSTEEVNLDIEKTRPVEQVFNAPGSNISILSDSITYINPQTQTAAKLRFGNSIADAYLPSLVGITLLEQHADGFGVLQTNRGQLYEINGDRPGGVNVTDAVFAKLVGDYHVALGTNGNAYAISSGKKVYIKKPGNPVAEPVLDTAHENSLVAFDGTNQIAVFKTPLGYPFADKDELNEDQINPNDYEGDGLVIYNIASKQSVELDKNRIVVGATWSPNQQMLAYALDSVIRIYSTQSKAVIASIEKQQILPKQLSWCSDSILAFSDTRGVWAYNLENKKTTLLAPSENTIISITCNSKSVYFSTEKTKLDGNINKINLDTSNDELIAKLNEALPYSTSRFSITYSATEAKPVVIIQTFAPRPTVGANNTSGGAETYERRTEAYRQEALKVLQDKGIDVNKVDVKYVILQ